MAGKAQDWLSRRLRDRAVRHWDAQADALARRNRVPAARKEDWSGARPTDYAAGALWKYAQLVGGARWGAVTHPGASAETHVYMDQ